MWVRGGFGHGVFKGLWLRPTIYSSARGTTPGNPLADDI
jgi:hypothetical protein